MTAPPKPDPADREPPDGGSPSPLGPGTTVNARYLIERELGRGGIGVVYLARDLRLHDMPVVIKFLLDDSTQNAWLSRKFLQEAEALTRIHHPGVVRVIDRDRTADGRPFFVMEFVKGVSLRSAIRPAGLDLEFAAAIVRDVGQALSAAHLEGVLHRDLKPENIMLETLSNGAQHAKLIDFGIAKVRDSREGASTELGTLAGSLLYMAPEQLLGTPASVASDIYAFAVVAYELLTGRRPFNPDAPSPIAAIPLLMTLQRSGQVVPPQQLRPSVSAAAQAIVLRGLAFDPTARLADARQFGDDLAQALRGAGEPTRGGRDASGERRASGDDERACAAAIGWRSHPACGGRGAAVARRATSCPAAAGAATRVARRRRRDGRARGRPGPGLSGDVTKFAGRTTHVTAGGDSRTESGRGGGEDPDLLGDAATRSEAIPGREGDPGDGRPGLFGRRSGASRVHEPAGRPSLHLQREPPTGRRPAERERPVPVPDQQRRLGTTRRRPDRDDTRPRRRLRVRQGEGCREALDHLVRRRPASPGRDEAMRQRRRTAGRSRTRPMSTPSTRSCGTTRRRRRTWRSTTTPG